MLVVFVLLDALRMIIRALEAPFSDVDLVPQPKDVMEDVLLPAVDVDQPVGEIPQHQGMHGKVAKCTAHTTRWSSKMLILPSRDGEYRLSFLTNQV